MAENIQTIGLRTLTIRCFQRTLPETEEPVLQAAATPEPFQLYVGLTCWVERFARECCNSRECELLQVPPGCILVQYYVHLGASAIHM